MDHADSATCLHNIVVHGDALVILNQMPAESVHLTFTSPPYYNARDYSTYSSYSDYLDFIAAAASAIHRVTKDGRFLVINTSPVIVPRAGRQFESTRLAIPFDIHPRMIAAGWRFIDDIVWRKPEASVKARNSGFSVHRQPLAYKPNAVTEYLMVYRKESDQLIDWNIKQYSDQQRVQSKIADGYETTNVWDVSPRWDPVHSAVFPLELCERVVAYYSMQGDLVLDPFAGSGTLALATGKLQRKALLIEQSEEYVRRIRNKLGMWIRSVDEKDFCKAVD